MSILAAEQAYLFRHALLREAAYQLQLPGSRARLHGLAVGLIEEVFGGRAPAPPALADRKASRSAPHPSDPFAGELAGRAYVEGLALLRDGGNPRVEALHRCGYAGLLVLVGQIDQARSQWRSAAAILHQLGDTAALARETGKMRENCRRKGVPPLDGV